MRNPTTLLAAGFAALLLALPHAKLLAAPIALTMEVSALDSEGRHLSLPAPAARLVSLSPAITEVLFAIGAGSQVVGVTSYCDYPAEALPLPKIGGFSASTISVERILALRPKLVIGSGEIHRPVEEALLRLGIPVFTYAPEDFEGIARDMRSLGVLTGRLEGSIATGNTMLASLAEIRGRLADLADRSRPGVFWEIYDEPLMTTGSKTFQHFIVEAAGGRNLFADLPGLWPRVSSEEVIRRTPDWIMGADDHGDKMSLDQIASRPGWSELPAVKKGQVALIPADLVSRPGPRVALGVLAVATLLYPERFKK